MRMAIRVAFCNRRRKGTKLWGLRFTGRCSRCVGIVDPDAGGPADLWARGRGKHFPRGGAAEMVRVTAPKRETLHHPEQQPNKEVVFKA